MPLAFDDVFAALHGGRLAPFGDTLQDLMTQRRVLPRHGNEPRWDGVLDALPAPRTTHFITEDVVSVGTPDELGMDPAVFRQQLGRLRPWRKGPWRLFGVDIDAEWRADMKWRRLAPHIAPLAGRTVLDVGCGNGYYLLRMLGEGAAFALGVDPTLLYLYQFQVTRRCLPDAPAFILPLRAEQLPAFGCIDTVFSMGVLYHCREPKAHLAALLGFLRPGGELVLETLVLPGDADGLLTPASRYARMANVHVVPGTRRLETWLRACGFDAVTTVDVTPTTTREQRRTDWMTFHSLADFLDPADPTRTVEGLPAPCRAILVARAPLRD